MIDPSSFTPPIKKGDAPLSPSQVMRKLSKAADRVLAPLHQKQVLFLDDPLKTPIGQAGAAVQAATLEINAFNHQLAARDKAQARLAQYVLADGRPEITEQQETGEFDPETGDPIMETVIIQSAIEPLPATVTVEVWDEETEAMIEQDIDNPEIVKDEMERAEAQATLDALPQDVLDWEAGE